MIVFTPITVFYEYIIYSCITTALDNRPLLESSLHYLQWMLRKVSAHMEGVKALGPEPHAQFARNRNNKELL